MEHSITLTNLINLNVRVENVLEDLIVWSSVYKQILPLQKTKLVPFLKSNINMIKNIV